MNKFFLVTDTIILGYLLNKCLKINYPEQYERLIVDLSTNCIYYFSKMQILLHKHGPVFDFDFRPTQDTVVLVTDGVVSCTTAIKDLIDYEDTKEYDMAIYSPSDSQCKRVYGFDKVPKSIDGFCCEKADFKFVLCELTIGDKEVKINFDGFYVVGNVFDSMFVRYFLNKYHAIETDDYIIRILDHNVNSIELTKQKGIKINKDNYEIIHLEIPCVD
jgi:hypothetical protein